jgi:hypothetical protein
MKMLAVIAGVFLLHLCIWSCVASILHQYFAGEYNNGKSLDILMQNKKLYLKYHFFKIGTAYIEGNLLSVLNSSFKNSWR